MIEKIQGLPAGNWKVVQLGCILARATIEFNPPIQKISYFGDYFQNIYLPEYWFVSEPFLFY